MLAKRMIELLIRSRDCCEAARQIRRISRDYRAIMQKALLRNPPAQRQDQRRGGLKQAPGFNGLMLKHAAAVLRFVTDLRVPFPNNLAEHAIRMPKVKQKISGCFRTMAGAQTFCTIRSYLDAQTGS